MAIDELLDEHEQGERVRTWLRTNGGGLIGGVLLGLAIIVGWQWWQKQREQRASAAGEQYQAAIDELKASKLAQAQPRVAGLTAGTYKSLAALQLAKAQVDAGQRDAAIATLKGVQADPMLAAVVTPRLARLLLDAGKAKDALALLPADTSDAGVLQVRGDALLALGQRDQARDAYAQALTRLEVGTPMRRVVELKLSEAGGTPAKPEAKT